MKKFGAGLLLLTAGLLGQAPAPPRAPARSSAAPARTPAVPLPRDLKYPPTRPVRLPQVEDVALANGMRVVLLEDHELPMVSGTAIVRTGSLFDPRDKVGLAALTGIVIRSGGSRNRNAGQLDEQLDSIGAVVESSIGESSGSVSFSGLRETADTLLAAFHDVLTAPELPQDRLDLAKGQLRTAIAGRNQDAAAVALREFTSLLSGRDTPYGWHTEYANLDRITRGDVQAFYNRYFFPANVVLTIRGDFNTADMKARLEKLFAGWTVKQEPVAAFPAFAGAISGGTYLAVKKEGQQTCFVTGGLGSDFKDPDLPALSVLAEVLAGGPHSRILLRARSRIDNSAEISAVWGGDYAHPGLFRITGTVKSPAAVEVIKAVREEIERLHSSDITEEEFLRARDTAVSRAVFALNSKAKLFEDMVMSQYYGYSADLVVRRQQALAAVTRADLLRVAKQRLDPSRLATVVVGNPDDFTQPLESVAGPVARFDITIPQFHQEVLKADPAGLEKGKRILQRIQNAVGGADKLAAVKDSVQEAQFQLSPEAGGFVVKETDQWIAPTHFRQDSVYPNVTLVAYYDGKFGWIATSQGSAPLSGPQLLQVQGDLFRWFFRLFLSDRIPAQVVNALDDSTVEISDPDGQVARLVVDPQTGMPQRVLYMNMPVSGPPVAVDEAWSDFRDVAGIKLPYRAVLTYSGHKFADVTVTSYKLNSGLRVQDLQKRP